MDADDLMNAAVPDPTELARRMETRLRQALRESTQGAVAAAMGVAPSTISRLLDSSAEQFCKVLAHAGLRIVSADAHCYSAEYAQALHVLSAVHLKTTSPQQLYWDDAA